MSDNCPNFSIDRNMTDYRNQKGLNEALNIYRSAMRSFIVRCLEKVKSESVEDLIVGSLKNNAAAKFEQNLQRYDRNVEASIDISDFPHIIRNCWDDVFEQQFNFYSNVLNVTHFIVDGRNQFAHLGTADLDSDYTWTYLFLISDVLGQINQPDAKRKVKAILDELFFHKTEEHPAEAENAAYKKRLADMSEQLAKAQGEKNKFEKRLKNIQDRREEVEAEWIASEERLETTSNRLEEVEAELTICKESLARTLMQLDEAETENTECEDPFNEIESPPSLNTNIPESIIFQGTTFTKHSNNYYVSGDDITQTFWYYWRAQGRDGKQKMREAGWSVKKVGSDWEITISPEDFSSVDRE